MKFMAVIEVDEAKLTKTRGGTDGSTRQAVEEEFGWLDETGISVRLLEDGESFAPKFSDIKIIGPILDVDKLVLGRIELATDEL